ncbi:STAS domain-containing protein [Actinokineospora sp. PR83]|uniref:STAS domain-containing protein n=1 Tax=Actinokineospora sp. PR83 TaxID=2884908 RepID=UPI001F267730|nr:STAS domain-containing protein [Actinokineospora sp. PR83]MCG8914270.1 STAS domain-containing protein [Actinokineospora sp. PR83]
MSTSEMLTVEAGDNAEAILLRVRGEIDMGTAPILRRGLDDAAARRTDERPVVLDLSGVGFLASAGLALLVEYHRDLVDRGAALRVVSNGGPVLRAIQVSSLDKVLAVYPSAEAALAADHASG